MSDSKNVTFRPPTEPISSEPGSFLKTNPERQTSNPSKRKQTILALLSELTDLRDEENLEKETKDPGISADATQDVNSREGVATFRAFDNNARSLDRQLQGFANSVRQLGSSVGLMNATYHLREALIQIEYFFRENAADLFTEIRRGNAEIARATKQNEYSEGSDTDSLLKKRRILDKDRIHTGMRPHVKPVGDFELFPSEMEKLSERIGVFVDRLNDIPEFTDELVNATFMSFASDLRYRASCLGEFKGQLKTIAVQRYINDLSVDIGMHMESMKDALNTFSEVGIPTIRHAQNHTANGLQYLSTVATFFSGVTATTIQYSFDQVGNTRADLVNALWIISLIFSIASAINSQASKNLAYHWRAAMYRSPRNYVPWWVTIWIKRSPLFFLIGSVIAFSIGLCVFTYSSGQSPVVSALVTAFTIVTSSGLISVGLWFASERWTFSRTRGQRWLWDILNDFQAKVHKYLGITWIIQTWPRDIRARSRRWMHVQIHDIKFGLRGVWSSCIPRRPPTDEEKDHASDYPGATYPRPPGDFDAGSITETAISGPGSPRRTSEQHMLPPSTSALSLGSHGAGSVSGHRVNGSPSIQQALLRTPVGAGTGLSQTPEDEERPKPLRLKSLVERVIAMNRTVGNREARAARARAESDLVSGRRDSGDNYGPTAYAHKARLRDLRPGLANLQITQFLNEHMALVKHMQFSPQGDFLATCSWDRTAVIWRITETHVEMFLKLYHPVSTGGFVNQVAWSPDGSKLLTRTQKGLKVWDATTGAGNKAISRPRPIQSTAWMPKGNGILSVEYKLQRRGGDVQTVTDTCLVCLDSNGTVQDNHTLPRIQIWDTAVMADETRVVAVGTLLKSIDNLRPTKSRDEKRLLVYNLKTRAVEHHVPLLQDVRNVTLSSHTPKSTYALISYENKAPPQMWRIDMKTGIRQGETFARLILVHSYLTKSPVDFAGQSYFGGLNDSFVCCSSKSGEIFIWDRTSATLLHTMRPEDSEVIKNFACNRKAAPGFMLVTGALDGALRIWSAGGGGLATPDRRMTSSPAQFLEGSSTPQRGASTSTGAS